MIFCDTKGVIYQGRKEGMNQWKSAYAAKTKARTLADALEGADAFFGLSAAGAVTQDDGEVDGGQAHHLRHGQPRPGDHAGGGRRGAPRRHRRHRPLGLPQPDQQRAGLPLHLPRRARRAGLDHQRGHEDRRRQGAGRAGARGRARPGGRRLPRPAGQVRPGLHHSRAVRPAPHQSRAARRRQGRHGERRGAPADRRHGGLRGAALRPARSGRRLAAQHLLPGAPCPQAHRLRRGRAAADRARRQRLPQRRPRAPDPDRPPRTDPRGLRHGRHRPHRRDRDARHQPRRAAPRVRRVPLWPPAAQGLPAARLPAARQQRPQRVRRLHGGDGPRRRHGHRRHPQLDHGLRGRAPGARCQAAPARDRRVDRAQPRPRRAGRRRRRARHAELRAAGRHRRGGRARRAPARHGAARRLPRLLHLRPAARRALRPRARGGLASSTSARSISSTTATWRPTWRSTARP